MRLANVAYAQNTTSVHQPLMNSNLTRHGGYATRLRRFANDPSRNVLAGSKRRIAQESGREKLDAFQFGMSFAIQSECVIFSVLRVMLPGGLVCPEQGKLGKIIEKRCCEARKKTIKFHSQVASGKIDVYFHQANGQYEQKATRLFHPKIYGGMLSLHNKNHSTARRAC